MKQAYTNTIRGSGARNPLTIATGKKGGRGGGSGKKSSRKQEVPKCAYGSACTRKGCAFRHPPKGEESTPTYNSYYDDPRSKICKPFLSGHCTFGNKCLNRHPGKVEADAVRAKYKQKVCSFGDGCQTEGCLYFHPWEALESAAEADDYHDQNGLSSLRVSSDLSAEINRLQIKDTDMANPQPPTYEQWVESGCLPPKKIDSIELFNMWHYPGNGMQRTPWEVYSMMYPSSTTSTGLKATSASWEPGFTGLSTDQLSLTNSTQHEEPKSFQEWKKKGCPHPSWFYDAGCTEDPWYDDEGIRRSLEEVYDVLYGENAQSIYQHKQAVAVIADPTPAESAEMIPTKQLQNTNEFSTSPRSGWASVAAKRPDPAVLQPAMNTANSFTNSNGHKSITKFVTIPKEVWLPDTANADYFHLYPDPIQRFIAVNGHHKSYLSTVTIPKSFDQDSANSRDSNNGSVALLDVHFQSAKTVSAILNEFLPPALTKNDEVWIITGSGHHVAVGHQRRETGGILFNAVKRYLEQQEEEMMLDFRIGKDARGGNSSSFGAFLVRRIS
ncbi:hypothetical protein ACHAXS_002060 [Conticribra weissflogii]